MVTPIVRTALAICLLLSLTACDSFTAHDEDEEKTFWDHFYGRKSDDEPAAAEPEKSLLLKRIKLPLKHDEHMPPIDEPQLLPGDIELLTLWVKGGAEKDALVSLAGLSKAGRASAKAALDLSASAAPPASATPSASASGSAQSALTPVGSATPAVSATASTKRSRRRRAAQPFSASVLPSKSSSGANPGC